MSDDRLASSNELILLNNRGIGGSTDDGQSFNIEKLADDTAHIIESVGIERASVIGWSMGGFYRTGLRGELRGSCSQARAVIDRPGKNRSGSRFPRRVVPAP